MLQIVKNFFSGDRETDDVKRLKEIEKKLEEEKTQISILMLGASEAGKSTFIRQMRIIHDNGYDREARENLIEMIYLNVFEIVQSLIRGMEKLAIPFSGTANEEEIEWIKNLDLNSLKKYAVDSKYWQAAENIWKDPNVQQCYQKRNLYHLSDNAKYYMDKLPTIRDSQYIPIEQDILNARAPTSGINEYSFRNNDNISFRIIDVGGQRNQRKKWLNCFENVTSVIFLAAISEYDQVLAEDPAANRLVESIELFRSLVCCQWFLMSSFILFLNKIDVLANKLATSNLLEYFPKYQEFLEKTMNDEKVLDQAKSDPDRLTCATNNLTDSEKVKAYFLSLFDEAKPDPDRLTYTHYTCATDTENIRFVFAAVCDTILRNNLASINLVN